MKNLSYKLHRPLVWALVYYIIGIIGGTIWTQYSYRSFCIFVFFCIVFIGCMYYRTKSERTFYLCLWIFLGFIRLLSHPVEAEAPYLEGYVTLSGTVVSKEVGPFNESLTLKRVSHYEEGASIALRSKVKVICTQPTAVEEGNYITLIGKVKSPSKVYNPSDMDYEAYLKSQGIVCEVQLQNMKEIVPTSSFINQGRAILKEQIKKIFQNADQGLVKALVLGDAKGINEETENIYRILGIGHILALSGLHLSLVSVMLWYILGRIGLSYSMRNSITIIGIWSYCLLTAGSVSIVRACIMLTVVLIIRSLWEEEDLFITCAIAAMIILGLNPFELYQVGFQLSFVALVGIGMVQHINRYMKHVVRPSKGSLRAWKVVMPSTVLTLVLSPILAYHFYEVPLLGIVLNIVVIPIFSMLIPVIFFVVGLSFMVPAVSRFLAYGIIGLLNGIEGVGTKLVQLPFVTMITGRPSFVQLALYYASITIVMLWMMKQTHNRFSALSVEESLDSVEDEVKYILRRISKEWPILLATLFVLLAFNLGNKTDKLEIMHLYIGQGDSCVITTPEGKTILVDSGPERGSETLLRYLKYKGVNKVDLAIISHPHEDHSGGLIKLMEKGMKVEAVVWADTYLEDMYRTRLIELCTEKEVKLHNLYKGDEIQVGELRLEVLWPYKDGVHLDPNEASLVCLLSYNQVTQLFTGDIGFEAEQALIGELTDIDLLKVAHHGSKNSTSLKFLEKVRPEYGMISSGVANRYGHPHPFTLERLIAYDVQTYTTSDEGAIKITTDGLTYTVETQ